MIICTCGQQMRCTKNGYPVVQVSPQNQQPMAVYSGDKFTCTTCDSSIVTNLPPQPFAQWNDATWNDTIAWVTSQEHTRAEF